MLRLGMVGGGPGSFIGPIHRRAAELDGAFRLVAGAFSRDPERSREAAASYAVAEERAYPDYQTMLAEEARRFDPIDLVAIVTPNHTHFAIGRDALQAGFHVVSDKPPTATLEEALALAEVQRTSGRLYALTYTYTGYAMLREARAMVRAGVLGQVRKVVVEYFQGWLSAAVEPGSNKQADWRLDPAQSGIGGCIGDIGVHAFNLAEFVSCCRVVALCADLVRVIPGRPLDDDCTLMLRFDNGAHGLIAASQIATGARNGLRLRIWGEHGGLDWSHERPDILTFDRADGVTEQRHAGSAGLSDLARVATRLPAGHPEGFIEALSTIYGDIAPALSDAPVGRDDSIQGLAEGVRSMLFVERAVENSRRGDGWCDLV